MELPLHPQIAHLPMALAVLMPLLSGVLLLAVWRGWLPARTLGFVVAGQLVLCLSGFFAMKSGEADEDRVERLVPKAAIERHEEAAETFVWASAFVLAVSILPLLLRGRGTLFAGSATVVGTFVVFGLGYQVGHAGGELVYRHNAGAAFAANAPGQPSVPAKKGDHDDDR